MNSLKAIRLADDLTSANDISEKEMAPGSEEDTIIVTCSCQCHDFKTNKLELWTKYFKSLVKQREDKLLARNQLVAKNKLNHDVLEMLLQEKQRVDRLKTLLENDLLMSKLVANKHGAVMRYQMAKFLRNWESTEQQQYKLFPLVSKFEALVKENSELEQELSTFLKLLESVKMDYANLRLKLQGNLKDVIVEFSQKAYFQHVVLR